MILTALTDKDMSIALAGGFLGAIFSLIAIAVIAAYVLLVVASWKIFTKAGIAGWKSVIPVYNVYLLYKISGVNFWVWSFVPTILCGVVQSIAGPNAENVNAWVTILLIAVLVYAIVGTCKFVKGLAKSFGKGTGFAVGLFFFPNIFKLILGFGKAKYVAKKK
ncbi:MAG: hypothetical protein IJF92_02895 [Bacilli bacterium]|nr:hypothetical protein [Bacilli bacterium]